jgi:hypothetical protein
LSALETTKVSLQAKSNWKVMKGLKTEQAVVAKVKKLPQKAFESIALILQISNVYDYNCNASLRTMRPSTASAPGSCQR